MQKQELGGGLEVLEADLAETENSVYHLVRSNVELAQVSHSSSGKGAALSLLAHRGRGLTPPG